METVKYSSGLGHIGKGARKNSKYLYSIGSNFLKLISKKCTRSELVNRANGPLLQNENSMNIRGVSPEKVAPPSGPLLQHENSCQRLHHVPRARCRLTSGYENRQNNQPGDLDTDKFPIVLTAYAAVSNLLANILICGPH
ncbi:hypothetical protein EVAR_94620_1 [Eumeta japonica]|uniref:Uncharacterized protein n=1 Tax=Eumeta variegata TaxID=151549 RepID=A0A4C1UU80_EUMVA|nr:hypothetical protein EVAR_94620_1 [Eumeta japonica]